MILEYSTGLLVTHNIFLKFNVGLHWNHIGRRALDQHMLLK